MSTLQAKSEVGTDVSTPSTQENLKGIQNLKIDESSSVSNKKPEAHNCLVLAHECCDCCD